MKKKIVSSMCLFFFIVAQGKAESSPPGPL